MQTRVFKDIFLQLNFENVQKAAAGCQECL